MGGTGPKALKRGFGADGPGFGCAAARFPSDLPPSRVFPNLTWVDGRGAHLLAWAGNPGASRNPE
jgi:hypothetical protein